MRRLLLALLLVASTMTPPASAAEQPETVGAAATLEDRLKTGLRVKAPRDMQFVETVARRVREGRLPARLVDSTYTWAIARGRKHPFPAFEHVIRLQAQKLNVPL
ncbi:MAG: hypothetical protein ACKOC8_03590 [Pirellulales bacterium]